MKIIQHYEWVGVNPPIKMTCIKCGIEKDGTPDNFFKHHQIPGGLDRKCKECVLKRRSELYKKRLVRINERRKKIRDANKDKINEAQRRWRKEHPEENKKYMLQYHFSLDYDEYKEMLRKQNGVCAICMGVNKSGRALSVDHNHTTGKKRGLLCSNHNLGIGYFKDNPDHLEAAAKYIRQHDAG